MTTPLIPTLTLAVYGAGTIVTPAKGGAAELRHLGDDGPAIDVLRDQLTPRQRTVLRRALIEAEHDAEHPSPLRQLLFDALLLVMLAANRSTQIPQAFCEISLALESWINEVLVGEPTGHQGHELAIVEHTQILRDALKGGVP